MSGGLKKEILEYLKIEFDKMKLENRMKQGYPERTALTLAAFVDFTAEVTSIMEISISDFDRETGVVQIYTTIEGDLTEDAMNEITKASEYLNMKCPLGNFGIYRPEKQLYHKYCILIDTNLEADEHIDTLLKNLKIIFEIVSAACPTLTRLFTGNITCEEGLAEGVL